MVRAADQLQWDVGGGSEPRPVYGSAAVVRGSTAAGSTANGGDDERTPGLHHLTARVYPPLLDYCVAGGGTAHRVYCRAACSCDAYAAAAPDYVATIAGGGRRRVHDRDCAARLRTVTAPVVSGTDVTPVYAVGAPPKRRRHRASDAGETTTPSCETTTPSGRQQADTPTGQRSTADCHQAPGTVPDGVARADTPSSSSTSPQPAPTTSANYATVPPELVTDCSLATNHASIHGPTSRPVYGQNST